MKKRMLLFLCGFSLLTFPLQAQYKLLHNFTGYDGAYPSGPLVVSGSTLFGTTPYGGGKGGFGAGTIFKIQMDGTGYAILHKFGGGIDDGGIPTGSPIFSGATIFGMTRYGGTNNKGTLFKIGVDGAGFALLHSFLGGAADGALPAGSLIISGSTIYGMTSKGGDSDSGTIFKMEIDGTGYTLLHKFSGGAADGADPSGSLILSNTTLYGMTSCFGSGNSSHSWGTIFKMETDGTGFTLLHRFAGGTVDGAYPDGSLILSGTTLFSMTNSGGNSDLGTIFKIQTDGSFFSTLHEFLDSNKGAWPNGSLILSDSILYGMTPYGGQFAFGVIFSVPIITVNSPNGGEKWREGSIQNISWTSPASITSVNIDYSIDNGSNWESVAAGTAANAAYPRTLTEPTANGIINDPLESNSNLLSKMTGTASINNYSWIVPNTLSPCCLIRISDAAHTATIDSSDAVFSILMSLDLLAERRVVKTFSILRHYGQIKFMGANPNAAVTEYRIMRRTNASAFAWLRTVFPSELQNNQFQMQDKYLDKGMQYTYIVEAYNAANQLIGISAEKTI
jgi:uncharacterized repeat protein (TIGR03803 family)